MLTLRSISLKRDLKDLCNEVILRIDGEQSKLEIRCRKGAEGHEVWSVWTDQGAEQTLGGWRLVGVVA